MAHTAERDSARRTAGDIAPAVVPGPKLHKMAGTLMDIWRDRLGLMSGVIEEFGDVVRFKMGPKTLYFFNHPEHARHVLADNAENYHKGLGLIQAKRVLGEGLLTSEDDLWRQQRRTIQPTFQRDRIARYAGVVVDQAKAMLDELDHSAGGEPVDVVHEMTHLTLGVLGQTLLDADLAPFDLLGPAFDVVQGQAMFEMVSLGMVPMWLPLPRQRRFKTAMRQLEDVIFTLTSEREKSGGTGGDDVISRLLEAYRGEKDEELRHRRLRDELVTILLAGHETTSSTLSWTWYLVSQAPEVRERMRAEALSVLGDRDPVYADLHSLVYTNQVIQEAMRLYPPVWILPRRALTEDRIDGFVIPAGADVMICPYTLHRHRDFWDAPDTFDPDRFDPGRTVTRHRYAYIPFGAGPRFCVGNNLGMMEAVLVAAMVARRFSLGLAPGYEVIPDPMLSLRVRGGLPMTVERA